MDEPGYCENAREFRRANWRLRIGDSISDVCGRDGERRSRLECLESFSVRQLVSHQLAAALFLLGRKYCQHLFLRGHLKWDARGFDTPHRLVHVETD
jgi:hypothetical protein